MDNTDAENLQTLLGVEAKEPLDKGLVTRLVLAVTIVALFVIFAVQNTESVTIEFLSWDFQLSQFLMMLLSAAAGVLIWGFAGAYSRRAKKKRS
ncbi:MAG: putative integral membrane protein [Paracrocinitomix sp.]